MRSFSLGDGGIFAPGTSGTVLPQLNDLFGFKGIAQDVEERGIWGAFGQQPSVVYVSPLAAVNATLMERAKRHLALFRENRALIDTIRDKTTREQAMAIVKKKWYPSGLFVRGRDDLEELAAKISEYVKLPYDQFVRFDEKLRVNRTRENRLNDFIKGNKELDKFLAKIIAGKTVYVERTAEALIAQAEAAAETARKTRTATAVGTAKAIAESAKAAAQAEGKPRIEARADELIKEMTALAEAIGVPAAGEEIKQIVQTVTPDYTPIIIIGAGVVVAVLILVLATRK